MRQLQIDLEELALFFEDLPREIAAYLDLETAEIIISEYGMANPDIDPEELEDRNRFLPIPEEDSRQGYTDMEDFIETVSDEKVRVRLEKAIQQKRPFRQFKDVLLNYPLERNSWFEFESESKRRRIVEWLYSHGIEAVAKK